jgi:hypothetical protein
MNSKLLVVLVSGLYAGRAEARGSTTLYHRAEAPLCEQDLTEIRIPNLSGMLLPPEGMIEHGLRPSLLHIQREICRCLPQRPKHQPSHILARLSIQPNAGQIGVKYKTETPWTRPVNRMMDCLGEPTLSVQPMRYTSDMITSEGRVEEVLGYFIMVELGQEGVDDLPPKRRR